jgi:hypothetical protein
MATDSDAKKQEVLNFLAERVFDPILNSAGASKRLKDGVRVTIARMNRLEAPSMVRYYWSAIIGTERSILFADHMREEGFTRFEDREVLEEFRLRFNDDWLRG